MSNKKRVYLFIILIFLFSFFTGCISTVPTDKIINVSNNYENARRATIDAWEKIIGPITSNCYNFTKETIINEVNTFPKTCKVPKNKIVLGCYSIKNNFIMIRKTLTTYKKLDTAVHEFIHTISFCITGYVDINHENIKYWDEFGQNTVEIWGCSNL